MAVLEKDYTISDKELRKIILDINGKVFQPHKSYKGELRSLMQKVKTIIVNYKTMLDKVVINQSKNAIMDSDHTLFV